MHKFPSHEIPGFIPKAIHHIPGLKHEMGKKRVPMCHLKGNGSFSSRGKDNLPKSFFATKEWSYFVLGMMYTGSPTASPLLPLIIGVLKLFSNVCIT
ncbi:hypothetical protein NPIL_230661 [Nephila pilipes]|uniref:Uncharacterized protein n=1 Tax=Nephila pilipes TaxID=299642 RepID=A0A8X6U2V5_NEPPI|nr:hypothetical protein NPIL_230661 [Nephila pilipes]